jgi:BirA family transcriptional regulator, biotin operon repressor / biotin---[acetyl-CoA-carboxylase] ligase
VRLHEYEVRIRNERHETKQKLPLVCDGKKPDTFASRIHNIDRPPFIIHQFDTIDSTNDYLKEMVNEPEFTCIVANEQTAGRGRRDRSWHSTPGDGLYMSVLLRPKLSSSKLSLLSLMAGVVVAETLMQRGVAGVDIKWPNDVLINERKLGGILVEGASAGQNSLRVILGIGVNLNHRSFPFELSRTATSLAIETGERVEIDQFRDQLLERLEAWYGRWDRGEEKSILNRWQELSSYARGKKIVVTLEGEQIAGETDGLSETGALRVVTGNGQLKIILAGEVMRLRIAGC